MGQDESRQPKQGMVTAAKIQLIFDIIEKDVKDCTQILSIMKTKEKLQEQDLEILRKHIAEGQNKFKQHIELLDNDGSFRKDRISINDCTSDPGTKLSINNVLKGLEMECKKWHDTVTNLKKRGRLATDKNYIMAEIKESEENLHKLSQIQIEASESVSQLPTPPDEMTNELGEREEHDVSMSNSTDDCIEQLMAEVERLKSLNDDLQMSLDSEKNLCEHGRQEQHVIETENNKMKTEIKNLNSFNLKLEENVNELKEKCENATSQLEQYQDKSQELSKQVADLSSEQTMLQNKLTSLNEDFKQTRTELEQKVEHLNQAWQREKQTNRTLSAEREDMLIRLSKVAGETLTQANPAIADLSDKNRPTKLGEMYSEIYDNEWTDALDGLKDAGHQDQDAIETLKNTLLSSLVRKQMTDAANLLFDDKETAVEHDQTHTQKQFQSTMPVKPALSTSHKQPQVSSLTLVDITLQQQWKPLGAGSSTPGKYKDVERKAQKIPLDIANKIKKMGKEIADAMVPAVQQVYIETMWDDICIPEMKPFIEKCLYIGWMMIVQSPPLCFQEDPSPGDTFDTGAYRQYVSCGKCVDYVVWPTLLLHESGAVVCKGVVEVKK